MALPTLDAVFASAADLPRRQMLAKWLVEELGSGSIADYYDLPERYLWAKIAVAAGAPRSEADYISLPKNYVWKAIYDAVSGSAAGLIQWNEKQALGHIAAAYRGDTGNPANLATYINWPWRYQVASIITSLATPTTYNAVIVSGAGTSSSNGTYQFVEIIGNGKAQYAENGTGNSVGWDGLNWNIYDGDLGDDSYRSSSDTEFPWQATGWTIVGGSNPVPTLTPTNV
jgi:hypothetical protein